MTKIPIILDTDIGTDIDDTWALGFALKCPELDIKLITTATGDTFSRAKIVAKFLQNVGRTDIPIGIGIPTKYPENIPQLKWLKKFNIKNYPGKIYENGIEQMIGTIKSSSEKITIVGIGPLTNVARAIKSDKTGTITNNSQFVGMQGSIKRGYQGIPYPNIEYNVKEDIDACRTVFESDWTVHITPLDTCGNIILSGNEYSLLENQIQNNPIIRNIFENFIIWVKNSHQKRLLKEKRTSVLFDTVAIYLAFSHDNLKIQELPIEITNDGFTCIAEDEKKIKKINVAMEWIDPKKFESFLVNRLVI